MRWGGYCAKEKNSRPSSFGSLYWFREVAYWALKRRGDPGRSRYRPTRGHSADLTTTLPAGSSGGLEVGRQR